MAGSRNGVAAMNAAGMRDSNTVGTAIPLEHALDLHRAEQRSFRRKCLIVLVALAVLAYLSIFPMGAEYSYRMYDPVVVAKVFGLHVRDFFVSLLHLGDPYTIEELATMLPDNGYSYYRVWERAGIVVMTLVCGVLLAVSGMLYQNTFKNPLAGPGMLGAGSGVSLGNVVLVLMLGTAATADSPLRYLLCYGLGAAVLAFVIAVGKGLSGKGNLNMVNMILIGAIVSQLVGVVVTFITLWIMEDEDWVTTYTLANMLDVDTGWLAWAALGVAVAASVLPVWILRFRMNGLAFDDAEMRLMGMSPTMLRFAALLCGAVMILAAQIHAGTVAMISLVVPFLSRAWFGCEFRKQFWGNVLLGMLVLLVCRDLIAVIPFVGDGLAIGSVVSIAVLPLVIVMMARGGRPWN